MNILIIDIQIWVTQKILLIVFLTLSGTMAAIVDTKKPAGGKKAAAPTPAPRFGRVRSNLKVQLIQLPMKR